jgi:monoamine oxidase
MEFGWASSGCDYEDVSLDASLKQFTLSSGLLFKEGMGTLIAKLAKEVEPYTTLNTRVTGFYTGDAHSKFPLVEVQTADGKKHRINTKCILNTIPPAVMNHKGDGAIDHDMPDWKTKAWEALPSGMMNKIIFEMDDAYFKQRDIDINRHYEILKTGHGNLFCLARPAGNPVFVAFVGGQQSIELEKGTADAAKQYALGFLKDVPELADMGEHIKNVKMTRWYQDPFSRGAYSAVKVGALDAREKAFEPVNDRVFFAGEACATGGWETQVYGAVETGKKAANMMIDKVLSKAPHIENAVRHPTQPQQRRR